jgi:hypothetical protein
LSGANPRRLLTALPITHHCCSTVLRHARGRWPLSLYHVHFLSLSSWSDPLSLPLYHVHFLSLSSWSDPLSLSHAAAHGHGGGDDHRRRRARHPLLPKTPGGGGGDRHRSEAAGEAHERVRRRNQSGLCDRGRQCAGWRGLHAHPGHPGVRKTGACVWGRGAIQSHCYCVLIDHYTSHSITWPHAPMVRR